MLTVWQHLLDRVTDTARIDTTTRYPTPGDLAAHLNPKNVRTPALDLIDQALVDLMNTPDGRLIITMPPQEGKSLRVAGDFPAWALLQQPDWRIITASYGQRLADRNGRAIRRRIQNHPELGLTVAKDHGAVSEWSIEGHEGGVYSVGIGGSVTGQACDLMIIDDPVKSRAEAESETIREHVWDWWTDEASSRFGAGTRAVLIMTRWHADDLAGRLIEKDADAGWRVLNIPAQADHDPADGGTDPLGREPGEFMVSARGRTHKQWEQRKKTAGSRGWQALYQGDPAPPEGALFKRHWWRRYDQPLWIARPDGTRWTSNPGDQVIISADFAFKDTTDSDYIAIGVWLRRGPNVYLLDQIRDRRDFLGSCDALRELAARWPQAALKLVEDKANGTAVINTLSRLIPGIVPEEPKGGKVERAHATVPFVEAGNVWLPTPELCPWIGEYVEELAAFPTGKNDDQCDQTTQAVNRLLLSPYLDMTDDVEPDEFTALDEQGFVYSPY